MVWSSGGLSLSGQPPPQLTSSKQPLALAVPLDSGHSVPWISRNTPHSFFLHPSVKSNNTLKKKIPLSLWKKGADFFCHIFIQQTLEVHPAWESVLVVEERWMDQTWSTHNLHWWWKVSGHTTLHTKLVKWRHERDVPEQHRGLLPEQTLRAGHTQGNKKHCGNEGLGRGPCICKRPLFYCCNTCLHSSVLQGFEVKIAVIPPEWDVYCPLNAVPVPIRMTPK